MEKSKKNLEEFKEKVKNIEIYPITAITNEGLEKVINS